MLKWVDLDQGDIESKKQVTKNTYMNNSIYTKFKNRQNYTQKVISQGKQGNYYS